MRMLLVGWAAAGEGCRQSAATARVAVRTCSTGLFLQDTGRFSLTENNACMEHIHFINGNVKNILTGGLPLCWLSHSFGSSLSECKSGSVLAGWRCSACVALLSVWRVPKP
jgi:hypothetical protein